MSPKPVRVSITRRFTAAPERVFDAWLDPDKARRFLFTDAKGQVVRWEMDARVGGKFVIVDRRGSEDIEHRGEYLVIERPRRLVFTFSVPKYSPLATRVSIEVTPAGSGCVLTLVHDGVLPEYERDTHAGWNGILTGLDDLLA